MVVFSVLIGHTVRYAASPSKNAWQRQLNENGIRALRYIACIQPEEKAEME